MGAHGVAPEAADALVARNVLPTAGALAAIFAFFIAADVLVREPDVGMALLPVDLAALALFAAVALVQWRRPLPAAWSQPTLALLGIAVLGTVFHLLVVEPLPVHSIYLMLVVLAAGSLLLSWAWFAALATIALAAWAFGASLGGTSGDWLEFGFGLVCAVGLGVMLQASRQRTFVRLHALHAQEVVARARAEASLEQARLSEERFHLLAEATRDVVWDWEVREKRVWWNDSFYQVFGHPRLGQVATSGFWADCVHPEDRARVNAELRRALAGRVDSWSREYRMRRADGSYLHVLDRGRALRDASGQTVRLVGSLVDVTEQREAQESAQRQAELYEKILDALGEAGHAVALVEDGGIAYANDLARPILQLDEKGSCGPILATALATLARDGGRRVDIVLGEGEGKGKGEGEGEGEDVLELAVYALDRGDARRVLLLARHAAASVRHEPRRGRGERDPPTTRREAR